MEDNVKSYRGFQVMILVPTTVEQVSALRDIEEKMTVCGLEWLTEGPVSHPNISGERFTLDVSKWVCSSHLAKPVISEDRQCCRRRNFKRDQTTHDLSTSRKER